MTVDEALDLCETILGDIDLLPDKALQFGRSVASTVEGIRTTIEENQYVTEPQKTALENMHAGVQKWLGPPRRRR